MLKSAKPKRLLTVGDIAKENDFSLKQVRGRIGKSGIEPTQRAGILRLFTEEQAAEIAHVAMMPRTKKHSSAA